MGDVDALPMLIWGGSGHAKVLRPIIVAAKRRIVACVERRHDLPSLFPDACRFSQEDEVAAWLSKQDRNMEFVLAIGGHNGAERMRLAGWLQVFGLRPFSAVHESAFVASTASLAAGCQILPMAAVCEEVIVGPQTIVNTNASVDHECRVGAGVHIMPGATVAGCVTIGDNVSIGSNATILPWLTIGRGAQIGAGAVVLNDVDAGAVVVGVPARAKLIDRPLEAGA